MGASAGKFADHFSGVAQGYAAYRPRYPEALFDTLAALAPARDSVWDCACGTGQASVALAHRFHRVVATDASAQQVAQAEPHERITYRVAPAEASGLSTASVSLVTVAQAVHWFDVGAFHTEAKRVLVPGGVIAEWSYGLLDVPSRPAVADLVNAMDSRLKMWWPPQRVHIDNRYTDLEFPFERIEVGTFSMVADWTPAQLAGYLATWSAVSRYRAAHIDDPMIAFERDLVEAWGDAPTLQIDWPLILRVGRAGDGASRG